MKNKNKKYIKIPVNPIEVGADGVITLQAVEGSNGDPFAYRRAKLKGDKKEMARIENQKAYRVFDVEKNEYL